jgi:TetR/AcrR family transcriptional regulator, regulator of cefoperazone and chloramphenicol sensitivity
MADQSARSPRELILEAAIDCIEREGIDTLTTRKIAEAAGTNIASINYYFRTKDLLVAEALSTTVNHMLGDVFDLFNQSERPFEEIIEDVMYYLIEGGLRFPGITLAHLYPTFTERRIDTPGVEAFRRLFERLAERVAAEFPNQPRAIVRMTVSQVISSIVFLVLAPGPFLPLIPLDITRPEEIRMLARHHADMLIGYMRGSPNSTLR